MSNYHEANVLLVEDDPTMARLYVEYLKDEPFQVTHVETGKNALKEIRTTTPQLILLDLKLPDMNGMDILKSIKKENISASVVIITSSGSVNTAVEAMREGAADFLLKPFNAQRLIYTLKNCNELMELTQIVESIKEDFGRDEYLGFIGSSLPMQRVYRIIDEAGPSKASVFITGESGTGKEICAQAIHRKSPRRDKPFIALNCAAIPQELMESEIFGHVKGAFTDAVSEREGAASLADGGTLFLDEICEMDLNLQAKLLRFIQTGQFQKVGGSEIRKVDIRFVSATNKSPWEQVEEGNFREDLYFRLHVIPVHLPRLSERDQDIMEIGQHFLKVFSDEEGKSFSGFANEAERIMLTYSWPGNVREMQNIIRNIVVLNSGEEVTAEMIDDLTQGQTVLYQNKSIEHSYAPAPVSQISPQTLKPMWMIEKETIEQAMKFCSNNVTQVSAALEMSPSTIYRRIKEFEQKSEALSKGFHMMS